MSTGWARMTSRAELVETFEEAITCSLGVSLELVELYKKWCTARAECARLFMARDHAAPTAVAASSAVRPLLGINGLLETTNPWRTKKTECDKLKSDFASSAVTLAAVEAIVPYRDMMDIMTAASLATQNGLLPTIRLNDLQTYNSVILDVQSLAEKIIETGGIMDSMDTMIRTDPRLYSLLVDGHFETGLWKRLQHLEDVDFLNNLKSGLSALEHSAAGAAAAAQAAAAQVAYDMELEESMRALKRMLGDRDDDEDAYGAAGGSAQRSTRRRVGR